MKSKKILPILLASCLMYLGACKPKVDSNEIVVGAILPLSGNAAEQGDWVKKGMEVALDEVNKTPNGKKLKIIFEDSKGADQQTAVSAYQFLRQIHSIPAVFSWGSPVGMVLSPRVNQDKVIQIGVATSTPLYSSDNDYTFRTYPGAGMETDVLLEGIRRASATPKIALLYMLTDYGQGMRKSFLNSLAKEKLELQTEETFNVKDTDFKAQLLKIKSSGADTLLFFGYLNEGALILRQAKELGLKMNIFTGSSMFGGGDFLQLSKGASEGLFATGLKVSEESGYPDKFTALFPDVISMPSLMCSSFAYEAVKVYYDAIQKCGSSEPDCIKNHLISLKNYKGALGTWSFDSKGDVDVKFSLFKVDGGEFKLAS